MAALVYMGHGSDVFNGLFVTFTSYVGLFGYPNRQG